MKVSSQSALVCFVTQRSSMTSPKTGCDILFGMLEVLRRGAIAVLCWILVLCWAGGVFWGLSKSIIWIGAALLYGHETAISMDFWEIVLCQGILIATAAGLYLAGWFLCNCVEVVGRDDGREQSEC